jgi:hypothetical protein
MTRAVYFPYINFRSRRTLLGALLLWDKVERIVPADYELGPIPRTTEWWNGSTEEVNELERIGLVSSVAPSIQSQWSTFDRWRPTLERLQVGGARDLIIPDDLRVQLRNGRTPDCAYTFGTKATVEFWNALEQARMAVPVRDGWYGTTPAVAGAYIATLAQSMRKTKEIGAGFVGESPEDSALLVEQPVEDLLDLSRPYARSELDARAAVTELVQFSFARLFPERIDDMTIGEFIQLRTDHYAQLSQFRTHMESAAKVLVEELPASPTREHRDRVFRRVQSEFIDSPLRSLEESLKSSNYEFLSTTAGIVMGGSTALLAALNEPMTTAVVAGAALVANLAARRISLSSARDKSIKGSPVGILHVLAHGS